MRLTRVPTTTEACIGPPALGTEATASRRATSDQCCPTSTHGSRQSAKLSRVYSQRHWSLLGLVCGLWQRSQLRPPVRWPAVPLAVPADPQQWFGSTCRFASLLPVFILIPRVQETPACSEDAYRVNRQSHISFIGLVPVISASSQLDQADGCQIRFEIHCCRRCSQCGDGSWRSHRQLGRTDVADRRQSRESRLGAAVLIAQYLHVSPPLDLGKGYESRGRRDHRAFKFAARLVGQRARSAAQPGRSVKSDFCETLP